MKLYKIFLALFLLSPSFVLGQIKNGIYSGLIEMCYFDSLGIKHCYGDYSQDKEKWYHMSYLKIMTDSAYLEMNPVYINSKGDTIYSASDGGFYYYKGNIDYYKDSINIKFKGVFCGYCSFSKITSSGDTLKLNEDYKLSGYYKNDNLILNNVYFKIATYDFFMESDIFKKIK